MSFPRREMSFSEFTKRTDEVAKIILSNVCEEYGAKSLLEHRGNDYKQLST